MLDTADTVAVSFDLPKSSEHHSELHLGDAERLRPRLMLHRPEGPASQPNSLEAEIAVVGVLKQGLEDWSEGLGCSFDSALLAWGWTDFGNEVVGQEEAGGVRRIGRSPAGVGTRAGWWEGGAGVGCLEVGV